MQSFFSYELTVFQIAAFYIVALLIGMSKTGVHGSGMLAVPILASVFGGQLSSGILLPMLCMADILGVWYYHRHASWTQLTKLLPAAVAGIIAGSLMGTYINDSVFKIIMAVVILLSIGLMLWMERREANRIPDSKIFAHGTGFVAGFTSMIGNLAGSVMAVYFLSMRLPKNVFIGTAAWFFLIINFMKVPFHVFHWKTINANIFLMDLTGIPAILLGGFFGVMIVKKISERTYRWFIIGMTIIASLLMLM